jgi:uncharacterized protein (TIGR00255 family)
MTGFGKSEFEINCKKITIEIKSLNSKQSDISTRIPQTYREKELDIRRELNDMLIRGKIDCSIFVESLGEKGNTSVNGPVVKNYFNDLSRISAELGLPVTERTLEIIMRFPDAVKVNYETLDEEEWELIHGNFLAAIVQLDRFRIQEGLAMETDLVENIGNIMKLLKEIEPHEQKRIDNIKSRMNVNLESLYLNGNVDINRFEQELIFYLERLDFNEEKVRLSNHCTYFLDTLNEPESNGRKLSFIAQEIGREINTIGSKANDSNIQRIVVQMKDALERVKEQVLNVL